ncbi:MAG: FAD-binding protein [Deinococcus sp.]|nr:FAD-binding protein [Deinococcus sp.]
MDHTKLISDLIRVVGQGAVLYRPEELLVYEADGHTIDKAAPRAIVLPSSTEQVSQVLRYLHQTGIPFVPRGAGTGLSGGSLALENGVVVCTARMRRILEVDIPNLRAVVEPGVANIRLSQEVGHGYAYAPDPSSQAACSIGGNVAENSGGPHCLKHGFTTNHVLGVELVLPEGEVVMLGGKAEEYPGLDLRGFVIGSEGTLGVVTKVMVRLVRVPEAVKTLLAVFDTVDSATRTVSDIIAAGVIPSALEMMDHVVIQAVERSPVAAGYPLDAAAVLLIELDGPPEGFDWEMAQVREICQRHQAREVRVAKDDKERALLWRGRKHAIGAVGALATAFYTQDGVIPRKRLPELLALVADVAKRYQLTIGNVFHAGDGNLHPLIVYDANDGDAPRRVQQAGGEIMAACVAAGGSLSGEHGIGLEKREYMPLLFSGADLAAMAQARAAFNPDGRCNPGKVFPTSTGCGEVGAITKPGVLPAVA